MIDLTNRVNVDDQVVIINADFDTQILTFSMIIISKMNKGHKIIE